MKELTNERIRDMKARIVMIIMAVALFALPTIAQDWQSTSTMQGTGSNYAPQVTAVGATGVSDMATTTESYTPVRANGPRRAKMGDFDDSPTDYENQDEGSPIGDAVLPLMLMAFAFVGYTAIRRKKQAEKA